MAVYITKSRTDPFSFGQSGFAFGAGVFAKALNGAGGNGDDMILDVSLDVAAQVGVDYSEKFYDQSTSVADQ